MSTKQKQEKRLDNLTLAEAISTVRKRGWGVVQRDEWGLNVCIRVDHWHDKHLFCNNTQYIGEGIDVDLVISDEEKSQPVWHTSIDPWD